MTGPGDDAALDAEPLDAEPLAAAEDADPLAVRARAPKFPLRGVAAWCVSRATAGDFCADAPPAAAVPTDPPADPEDADVAADDVVAAALAAALADEELALCEP
jgi:hypothetical protein